MGKLDALCSKWNKSAAATIVQQGLKQYNYKLIPFSSVRANYMCYGGIPRGKLIEFFGEESGGKTTTALDICANAQRVFKEENPENPLLVLYVDAENTFDSVWATKLGVDVDKLFILSPESQSAEDLFQFILEAIDTGEIGLVVIDSLGVLVSQQAYEKEVAERTYGGISMALTNFGKKAVMLCQKYECTIIAINQLRDNLNSMYGGTVTTGGRGWRHGCSVRIQFSKGDFFDAKGGKLNRSCENPQGNLVQMAIVKAKSFMPDRKLGFYTLNYHTGIDKLSDLFEVAVKLGIITQGGPWFTLANPDTGEVITKLQGKYSVIEYLKENEDLLKKIEQSISISYIAG